MQHRFPVEVPLLLDQVQVTHRCLRQAHEQLGASLLLYEYEALIQPRHCKQAIKVVHTMGELAACLPACLLMQDCPASLTASLRLRLSLLKHYTEKAAMQLALAVLLLEAHGHRALAPPAGVCLPRCGHGTQWRNAARTLTLCDAGTPRPAGGVCRGSSWRHCLAQGSTQP